MHKLFIYKPIQIKLDCCEVVIIICVKNKVKTENEYDMVCLNNKLYKPNMELRPFLGGFIKRLDSETAL